MTLPFLTKRDEDLDSAERRTDPLGVGPIWSAAGHELLPHLTESTNHGAGFTVLTAGLWLHDQFLRAKPERRNTRQELFFLLIEQMFAWSSYPDDWPLPGTRQLNLRASEPAISRTHQILDNPLASGVWGLYRTSAERAGLIEQSSAGYRVSDAMSDVLTKVCTIPQAKLFAIFDEVLAVDNPDDVPFTGHAALKSSVVELLNSRKLRVHLYQSLIQIGSIEAVAQLLAASGTGDLRSFVARCKRTLPGIPTFDTILRTENYIGFLEECFRFFFRPSATLGNLSTAMVFSMDDLRRCHREFEEMLGRPHLRGVAASRARLCASLDLQDKRSFIQSLIELHETICEERQSGVWIRLEEGGYLRPLVDLPSSREWKAEPGQQDWRNDYYFSPLLSLYRGLSR